MRRSNHDFLMGQLLFLLAVLALGCATSQFTRRDANVSASPSPVIQVEGAQDQSDAINRPTSKPYTGELSIFEDPKRDENLQPNRIMDILGIKEGSTVADIGAGSGWFTVRAARRVGPSGLVYAVDINPAAISYINDRAKREHLENIRTVQGREDDPLLASNSIDSVLLLKTYHEVA